jgi:hypothetical protein
MPGIYGKAAPVAMQPGDRALVMGLRKIPGFQGNVTPGGNGSSNDSQGDYPETLGAGQASGPVVIAAMGGRHPSTQRQLIWQVYPTGTADLNLQVATADNDADYVTIDTTGSISADSGPRVITADVDSSGEGGPGAQATLKVLSSARFIRVKDSGSGSTAIVAVTSL